MNSNTNPYMYGACEGENNAWKPAGLVSEDFEAGNKIDTNAIIRLGFIKKVYGILSTQLLLTTLMCILSMSSKSFAHFQQANPGLMWGSMILGIILMLAICCVPGLSRQVPTNYILLFAFTFCEAYMVSALCSVMPAKLVFMAAAMTCAITIALTLYACTTKSDFTVCGSMLFIAACCLFLLTIFSMFFKALHVVVCVFGVFLYAIYLVYDTQLLVGNKENALDMEDYILGAIMLYLDIINLFVYLLQILKTISGDS